MINTEINTTEDMINKLQELEGKTKKNFFKNKSNYYNNMNIKMYEDIFARNAPGMNKIYHEVLLSMKFPQTKPQVRNMNIIFYDLYYTVIKNRDKKEIVNDQYENHYIIFNDIVPNHYPERVIDNIILKKKIFRSQIIHFNKFILYKKTQK